MGRNGVLGCISCSCFSAGTRASPPPGKGNANNGFAADAGSSSDSEVPLPPSGTCASSSSAKAFADNASSQIHQSTIPSCKLVPLRPGPAFPQHAVGINDQVNNVIGLLEWEDETNVAVAVILHGFGGAGKTTLADAVVATLDFQGWNSFTVVPFQSMGNVSGQGETQEVFENKQAFIYMDSVMLRKEDLEKLLPKSCKKVRLLLTARDERIADVISACERGILTHVYHVRPLHCQDAMKLLCNKMRVAGDMQMPHHHMSQIDDILKICEGVPVVLERVGAYICQSPDKDEAFRRVTEWSKDGKPFTSAEEHSIEKKGLLFDLDELPASAREPFLDICSFFNAWDWDKVSCIVGEGALNSLRNRALLLKKEESENKVMLRPIVLTIGRNMTKGKRFTSADDLTKVLEGNNLDDIRGIKGIWLQDNISQPFLMSAKTLDLMHKSLRVLALGDMVIVVDGQYCTQQFKQIIYFQAGPIPYIPFQLTALQELRFLDCRFALNKNDLQVNEMSSKLTMLYLNGGQFETRTAFGRMPGLRILKLTEFNSLKILPEELGLLTLLEELDLTGCGKLQELPKGLGDLETLTKLSLRSCRSLQELPECFGKLRSLKYLDLHSCVALKQLPEDFGSLSSLEELDLGSGYLKELPGSFEQLSSLKVLSLMHCGILEYLPDNIGNLSALVKIEFEGSGLRIIPPSFERLSSNPVSVSMAHCSSLRDLPEEFCTYLKSVKDLMFGRCQSLTNLPKRLVELTSLTRLDLYYCTSLERLPEGFGQLKSLAVLNLKECHSLKELPADFHCLASLQSLNMQWCMRLEGKWMDAVAKIKSLEFIDIIGSIMLLKRRAEMEIERENQGESWQFLVRTGRKKCKNILKKAASKFLTEKCLLTDPYEKPFSLSTVAPDTPLLVMYEHYEDSWTGPWRLLEEIVQRHDHPFMPFQMIYVGKHFGALSKKLADRILAFASDKSDAFSLFYRLLEVNGDYPSHFLSNFVLTDVVTDEEGSKQFSRWEDITHSCVEFFLSQSSFYSELQKMAETPQESNEKLLRILIDTASAESRTSAIFLRNYTEKMGVDQLRGKTVLLLISLIDEHPFESLKEIYPKFKASDNMEIVSIPIPVEVRGRQQQRSQQQVALLPDSDLAGLESILRKVPWPVLRNPWSLKTEVCYFLEREWGELNPGILVVVDPNGRILNKNALPLIETWGAELCPFTQEKMRQLEQEPPEEHLSECILNGLLEKWSN